LGDIRLCKKLDNAKMDLKGMDFGDVKRILLDARFSRCAVRLNSTNVSEERITSIFNVEE
jgi:hypothetical protein